MEQFCSVGEEGEVRFLPDRYVQGICPACSAEGARGDQCDACGATYEANELREPVSKLYPDVPVEIRETEHLFFSSTSSNRNWRHMLRIEINLKPNVRSMTKNWLNMGLRPRAILRRRMEVRIPLDDQIW